jgi:hypothetical protein
MLTAPGMNVTVLLLTGSILLSGLALVSGGVHCIWFVEPLIALRLRSMLSFFVSKLSFGLAIRGSTRWWPLA